MLLVFPFNNALSLDLAKHSQTLFKGCPSQPLSEINPFNPCAISTGELLTSLYQT